MARLRLYQVDAFAQRLFAGNPAAVVPLDQPVDDPVLQAIAEENNLSETAFVAPVPGDDPAAFRLRWFTPTVEVDLCGHATLAAAHVLWAHEGVSVPQLRFLTRSGPLLVERAGDGVYAMDFPAVAPLERAASKGIVKAAGGAPCDALALPRIHQADYALVVYGSAKEVAELEPDLAELHANDANLLVTAAGDGDVDVVSRFFAPASGVAEDPVTGSAHCTLAPYWAARLGRDRLNARQLSTRGGAVTMEARGDRVRLEGRCVDYLTGEIAVPAVA